MTNSESTATTSSAEQPFATTFLGDVLPDSTHDPQIVAGDLFDDGRHRVISGNSGTDQTFLHTTKDFDSFTQIGTDILPDVDGTGQCAGATVLADSRALVLVSSDAVTEAYAGEDFTSLSRVGQFCPEPDGGLFYEREAGALHYYPEDADTASGVSSTKLSHWMIPDDDLLNPTQRADALDTGQHGFKTGDPAVIEVGDRYYMFMDNTVNHPQYHIALAVGETLDNFSLVSPNITPDVYGGDLTLIQHDDHFEALTEYSQNANAIGHWRLHRKQ